MSRSLQELYNELQSTQEHTKRPRSATEEPVLMVKVVQLLFAYGVSVRASDIHIEPHATGMRVRYRIDGILHELLRLPQEMSDSLIRSIKLRANMVTDPVGRSKPQDGRIEFEVDSRKLDLRLSSFPTLYGDVLAIRIMGRSASRPGLEQLGFPQEMLRKFEQLIRKPNGFILVCGPTNSGKTTTLYAVLDKLRSPYIKTITLEDPVEHQMEGIDQGEVNSQVGLTFASGLRAILRQDANIILVGEIRDKETADVAIRAALTGHLVFSTLHTRYSCGAVIRLMDMEIDPHLIVTSLTGILAQRLVRLLCPNCKIPDPNANRTFERLWMQEARTVSPEAISAHLYKGSGCSACNNTGYRDRTGIFELLVLNNEELKRAILDRATNHFYKTAVTSGMRTMLLDGLGKVAKGLTSIEEVLRVTGETEDV